MEFDKEDHANNLLRAQTQVFNHIFNFVHSMSLKCAIDLGIPDLIHNYGQPMPLSKLITSLPIHPSKTETIYRLMRILTLSGFLSQQNITENDQEATYVLTDASRLLLKDHPLSMISLMETILDPTFLMPWYKVSTWIKNEDPTPFYTENGMTLWDYAAKEPKLNHLFNDAMACETRLGASVVIEKCKEVFEGFESLVDVGGGTGTMAKTIAKSFPEMECIVFDLPHVVDGLQGTKNMKYVGGDMFEAIPHADCILFKGVLHDWKDEDCLKILKKCKEAIASKEGKLILIEVVMGNDEKGDTESFKTKIFYDLEMLVVVNGKERNEKEWAKLFFSAGFSNYKITPDLGFKSLIEVYP